MKNNHCNSQRRDPSNNPDGIADGYVLNQCSGLYEQIATQAEHETKSYSAGKAKQGPFYVTILRDWFAFILSIATVSLLVATVFYTRRQWVEANKSAKAAQWSEYFDCLNVQSVQDSLTVARESAEFGQVSTEASIAQAAAGIEAQRAIITFVPRFPKPEETVDRPFGFPFLIKNEGKSSAKTFSLLSTAIYVPKNKKVVLDGKGFVYLSGKRFPAGAQFPEKPTDDRFRTITKEIFVHDSSGNELASNSDEAKSFYNYSGAVFIYGKLNYSDFAGSHSERFCLAMELMAPGTNRPGMDANERQCGQYYREHDTYNWRREVPKIIAIMPISPPACKKPEN